MEIAELIEKILKEERDNGKTQWDLAKKYNISQTQIQKLLKGERKFSGLTVATVQKMFPMATLDLAGGGNNETSQVNSGHSTGFQQFGGQIVQTVAARDADADKRAIDDFRVRVQDRLLEGDDPVAVRRVFEILKAESVSVKPSPRSKRP